MGELSAESQISLQHVNATPLPFDDQSFDVVTSLEALEFFPDDAAALREMVRVLRRGGFLMVTRRKEWEAYTFLWHYRSRENMRQLLTDMGMNGVQVLDWQTNYDLVVGYKGS
jgi:ubiquinone/menaquinone biosynthesis C-methylase UbiE